MCHHPGYDTLYDDDDSTGFEYDDSPSVSRMAVMYDTGKACAECFAEFTEANGEPSSCEYCKRRGSELPKSKHPELNRVAHANVARKRKARKKNV